MTITPEEAAANVRKYQLDQQERDRVLIDATENITEEQREAISFVYKCIQDVDNNLHEMLDVTMENARTIDQAEYKLRAAFPSLCFRDY